MMRAMPSSSPFRAPQPARFFWTLLALVFLGLTWLWDHLHPLIRAVVDALPLRWLKEAVARFVAGLSPYATLTLFLVPLIASEPLKLGALWVFARGHWGMGATLIAVSELLRYGLAAFIFTTCREKLLAIAWFRRLHDLAMRAHDWARAQTEPLRRDIIALKQRILRRLLEAGWIGGRGAFRRKIAMLWRRARG